MAIAMLPLCAMAQTNVRKAFDKLIQNSDFISTESHSIEKDAKTGIKESQCDIYNFTLPASKIGLIDNIRKAFKADEPFAYTTSSGVAGNGGNTISLAVGNGDSSGVYVNPTGYNYIYSCYLAPESEDASGNYRYAYSMNWKENDGIVTGTLTVTYATTLKYRQSMSRNNNAGFIYRINNTEVSQEPDTSTWFGKFMSYLQAMMATESPKVRQALATKIYEHTKSTQKSNEIKKEDKDTAREILKGVISEKRTYDSVTKQLLNSALVNIK